MSSQPFSGSERFDSPKNNILQQTVTGLLNEIAFATMVREGMDSETLRKFSYRKATQDFYQLLHSLQKIEQNLNTFGQLSKNGSLPGDTNKTVLNRWYQVRNDLTNTWLITTLLLDASDVVSEQTVRLKQLQYFLDENTINCQRRKIKCNESSFTPFLTVSHTGCRTYDLLEGNDVDESRIQCINNGVTFIFMTGSKISAIEYDNKKIFVFDLIVVFSTITVGRFQTNIFLLLLRNREIHQFPRVLAQ